MDRHSAFNGKDIAVTGAGGYIGSGLVKAIITAAPRSLTLIDHSEHHLFELWSALKSEFPWVHCTPIVGSVADKGLMHSVFDRFPRHFVFHAAAFKHVELMELNPFSALANNALGTHVLAQAALVSNCESFVLVSTDKAVRPHSVMGASKRLAELFTLALAHRGMRMNAVRLCNIFASSGSVIPVFEAQLSRGKPLTITHPDAERCFLSLDEAVESILEASLSKLDGCVLMPKFPPPTRIADLVQNLTKGGTNYPVETIGLRPGEKLHEDFVGPEERQDPIDGSGLILIESPTLSAGECDRLVERLAAFVEKRDLASALELMAATICSYAPSDLILRAAQLKGL